jgi:hypothetical protein
MWQVLYKIKVLYFCVPICYNKISDDENRVRKKEVKIMLRITDCKERYTTKLKEP